MNSRGSSDLCEGSKDRGDPPPTALENRLAQRQSTLTAKRKLLIQTILENAEDNYFLSSSALAKRYGTDTSTLVRAIRVLGYRCFADFAADLRRHFVARITPLSVIRKVRREKRTVGMSLKLTIEQDCKNLRIFQNTLDERRILEVAEVIHRARRIVVVGVDLAAALAYFLGYSLRALGFSAEAPVGSRGNLYHTIRDLNSRDFLIAISFGRCLRETVEALQLGARQHVRTFGITDSDVTPVAKHSDGFVLVPVGGSAFGSSYAAAMSAINTILTACARVNTKKMLTAVQKREKEYVSGARWYRGVSLVSEGGESEILALTRAERD